MTQLAVDPTALDAAGQSVLRVGEALGPIIATLTTALGAGGAMAGDDPVGTEFGHAYDGSVEKTLAGLVAVRNTLCHLGDGVRMSAHNYSMAEAASNVTGSGAVLPVPGSTDRLSAGSAPSAVGHSVAAPAGWGWVVKYLGMIWPTGDSERLRAVSAAWSAAAQSFQATEMEVLGPLTAIRAQQIPEAEMVVAALRNAQTNTVGAVGHCLQIAAQLNGYAERIDRVHVAIVDLLRRICDPLTGLKEIFQILTRQDEDEIKKVADDIRTVVDHFKSEARALKAEIWRVGHAADQTVTALVPVLQKRWESVAQYFHSSDANPVEKLAFGAAEEAGAAVAWMWGLGAEAEQHGVVPTAKDKLRAAAPLVGLGGEGAPGVASSWKELGKGVSHWDQWSKDGIPETAGRVLTDFGAPARIFKSLPGSGAHPAHAPHPGHAPHVGAPEHPVSPAPGAVPPVRGPGAVPPAHPGVTPPAHPGSGAPAPAPLAGNGVHAPVESKPPPVDRLPVAPRAPVAEPGYVPPTGPRPPSQPTPHPVSDGSGADHPAAGPPGSRPPPGGQPPPAVLAHTPSASAPEAHPSHTFAPDGHALTGPPGTHGGDGHGHSGHGPPGSEGHENGRHVPDSGLSVEKRDEIIGIEKGNRPDPSEYLSSEYINSHLKQFEHGATRFMPESNLEKYGIAQRDGTSFVMPRDQADALLDVARGNREALEDALGLPEGFLESQRLVRVDIVNPSEYNLRLPSGNEAGANAQWMPGGMLPDGGSEAVIDGGNIPSGAYTIEQISE